MAESVVVTKSGSVTTVLINRPESRNAVDGPTADLLAAAFRAFEADESSSVAVLSGVGPAFLRGCRPQVGGYRQNESPHPSG